MILTRRAWLAAAGGGLALSALPRFANAATGARRFQVIRDGEDIGWQTIDVSTGADGALHVAIDIELRVKLLGVTAYRYEMRNRETWRDGRLVSMDSRTDDDGDKDFVRVKPAGDALAVEGSAFQGQAPAEAASTTYWSMDFLNRGTWINSQTGVPIAVTAEALGPGGVDTPAGRIATERWRVTGDNLDVTLHYADGEWVSVAFDAGGAPAIYIPTDRGADFAALWNADK